MKKTITSPIIFTIILCHSIFMSRANISGYNWPTEILQTGRTDAVETMGHVLKDRYHTGNKIPTEDDTSNPKIKKHLQAIENALMEEDTEIEIDYLNKYPESSWTPFLKQSYQESNNILPPKDTENIMGSPNLIRKRLRMEDHTNLECSDFSFKRIHEDCTPGGEFEEHQLDIPTLNPGPQSRQIVHHPNKQRKKEKEKLVGMQLESHGSKPHRSSRSHVPQLKSLELPKGSRDKLPNSPLISDYLAMRLLKSKGATAVWHNPKVLKQIELFFNGLNAGSYSLLKYPSNTYYTYNEVNQAITRVKIDVVVAYFGALSIMFQGKQDGPVMQELIANGWEILQKYLIQYLARSNKSYFTDPKYLLQYIVKLDPKTTISASLVKTLIAIWSKSTIYKPRNYQIDVSSDSLSFLIGSQAALRGPQIWMNKPHVSSEPFKDYKDNQLITKTSNLEKFRPAIEKNPAMYFGIVGVSEMLNHMDFTNQIVIILRRFKHEMIKLWKEAEVLFDGMEIADNSNNLMKIKPMMISNAISLVYSKIMPAFLGIITMLNRDQAGSQVIEQLLRSGWITLQKYLERWKDVLLGDASSIILSETRKAAYEVKWYDAKDSLHYLCQRKKLKNVPVQPLWFLVELWYEEVIEKRVRGEASLEFEPVPPTRDVYNHLFSHLEKTGLVTKRNCHSRALANLPNVNLDW
ncbi:hypothetical protein DFH28DRAFT_941675 [Melampsora americana]|nr:hypothetical protein DFH28DRAFT_941675 [Melampsora americana]